MEYDLVGEMAVDADAYYGIHALRAAENFPITHTRLPGDMIVSMAWIKKACARANRVTGALSSRVAEAIERACDELIDRREAARPVHRRPDSRRRGHIHQHERQ